MLLTRGRLVFVGWRGGDGGEKGGVTAGIVEVEKT